MLPFVVSMVATGFGMMVMAGKNLVVVVDPNGRKPRIVSVIFGNRPAVSL